MQVEADIRPFRGMLLGLFFVSTGGSLDLQLLLHEWPIVTFLLAGLLATKVGIIGTVAQFFGLSRYVSPRHCHALLQMLAELRWQLVPRADCLHVQIACCRQVSCIQDRRLLMHLHVSRTALT